MTAALTAPCALSPTVKTPWFLSSTAGAVADVVDHLLADGLAADQRKAGAGNRSAELVGLGGEIDRDRPAHGGEGRGVGRMGVHDAVDIGSVAIDVEMAGRVRRRLVASPSTTSPSRSSTTWSSGRRSSYMMPLGLMTTRPLSGSRALTLPDVQVTSSSSGSTRCSFQSSCLIASSMLVWVPFLGLWGDRVVGNWAIGQWSGLLMPSLDPTALQPQRPMLCARNRLALNRAQPFHHIVVAATEVVVEQSCTRRRVGRRRRRSPGWACRRSSFRPPIFADAAKMSA